MDRKRSRTRCQLLAPLLPIGLVVEEGQEEAEVWGGLEVSRAEMMWEKRRPRSVCRWARTSEVTCAQQQCVRACVRVCMCVCADLRVHVCKRVPRVTVCQSDDIPLRLEGCRSAYHNIRKYMVTLRRMWTHLET
eukprot:scaffold31589_cov20-Tisochrysis_lutea.AAC.4